MSLVERDGKRVTQITDPEEPGVKRGVKTSEFAVTVAVIGGIAATLAEQIATTPGVPPVGIIIAGIVSAALTAYGYQSARARAKGRK